MIARSSGLGSVPWRLPRLRIASSRAPAAGVSRLAASDRWMIAPTRQSTGGQPALLVCLGSAGPGARSGCTRRRQEARLPQAVAPEASYLGTEPAVTITEHARQELTRWVEPACQQDGQFNPEAIRVEVLPLADEAGQVAVGLTGYIVQGIRTAVVCIAVQRASPEVPRLDGAVVHWACEKIPGGNWYPPPQGWRTNPDWSVDAGGGAWQTPLRPNAADGQERRFHSVLLEIPLTGPLKSDKSGLPFVIKTASGQWIKNGATSTDFFVHLGALLLSELPAIETVPSSGTYSQSPEMDSEGPGKLQSSVAASGGEELFGVKINMELPQGPVDIPPHSPDLDMLPSRQAGSITSLPRGAPVMWVVDAVAGSESKAERSLMHRYQIAHTILSRVTESEDCEGGMPVLVAWLRFSATRHLTWNRNYNVKPREISVAQDLLTKKLSEELISRPELWEVIRIAMVAIGRGGQGDVGQRIRDEILSVQSKNNAKGGMMEEWHQKLHNNTSPDDVVICEALLAYLKSGLDIGAYWDTLHASNINQERLASFDRAIRNEPNFTQDQVPGLTRDLEHYLHTLKAVHCGDDLKSACAAVLGYSQEHRKGRNVDIQPIPGVATPELRDALIYLLQGGTSSAKTAPPLASKLQAIMAARQMLAPHMSANSSLQDRSRLRDVIFLDLALESAARSYFESEMDRLKALDTVADLKELWRVAVLMLEGCCQSLGANSELILCLKEFVMLEENVASSPEGETIMRAQAATQRLKEHLGSRAQEMCLKLQPSSEALGGRLGIDSEAVEIFSEEVVRAGPVAPMSQLVSAIENLIRTVSCQSPWQIVAPCDGPVIGQVVVTPHLADVQGQRYDLPTLLVATQMGGEEDIPMGVVGVVTQSTTDVLCHAAIRARNFGVLLVTCFSPGEVDALTQVAGKWVSIAAGRGDSSVTVELGVAPPAPTIADGADTVSPDNHVELAAVEWCGQLALPSSAFTPELVGAKSLNLEAVRGKLPPWIHVPESVAIPYGVFEQLLSRNSKGAAARRVKAIAGAIEDGDINMLAGVRLVVKQLPHDGEVARDILRAINDAGMQLQDEDWPAAWEGITAVWASQWNDRVVLALQKANISHRRLCMSVLCQPLLNARYAFVAHTANPLTGNTSEIYIEIVKGLGEVLVGNYAGAALRATAHKADTMPADAKDVNPDNAIGDVQLTCLPSKSVALIVDKPSLIFRSDSNCEDLEGLAGAGFFDSVPLHTPREEHVDYSAEPLVNSQAFRTQVLRNAAAAAAAVEVALGGKPQDVEGVVLADGTVCIVQSRPQV